MAETQNSKQNVQAPQAGQTVIVNAIPGQDIVLEAAFDQAEVKLDSGNVIFEFANGGQVVLDFSDIGTAQAPNVVMPDGTILNMEEFLASLGESDVEPAAGPEGGGEGSGGVGEYRDDAGDLIGSVDKLGGLDPRGFSSISVAALEANNSLPSAGFVDGAADEDGMSISEKIKGNNDNRDGDHPAQFSYVEGFLSYDFGGDGPAGTNPFVWSLEGLAAKGVTSQGNTLLYEVVDGVTLNAYYMGTDDSGDSGNGDSIFDKAVTLQDVPLEKILVFTIQVTDLDTGAYRFELYRPLDHSDPTTEDDIVYNFSYTITDGTGDTAVGGVNMIVDDDSPIWKAGEASVSALVVEEAMSYKDGDLSEGNEDDDGSGLGAQLAALPADTGTQTSIEAFLGIAPGGLSPLAASGVGADIATNGSAMKTVISVEAGDEISFSWSFTANDWYGSYNDFGFVSFNGQAFELADVSSVGGYGQKTPWSVFTYTATVPGSLTIGFGSMNTGDTALSSFLQIDNVKLNGVLVPNGGFGNGDFSNWVTLGNPTLITTPYSDYSDEAGGLSGSLGDLVSFGADGPGEFSMLTDTSELPSLFSKGEAVQYIVEGNTLIAYVEEYSPKPVGEVSPESEGEVSDDGGYRVVFTLQINPDGSWYFDLQDQLDHVDDGAVSQNFDLITGEGVEGVTSISAIDFSSLIKVTDGDGDELEAAPAGSFTIQVQDDVPVTWSNNTVYLDDEAASTTYADPNFGGVDDQSPDKVNATGTLAFSYGADEEGSVLLTDAVLPDGFSQQLSNDGLLLTVYQDQVHGEAVVTVAIFEIALENSVSGKYTVTQLNPAFHPLSGSVEENVEFTVRYTVTDADLDTSVGSLLVSIDDDTPVIVTQKSHILSESFESFATISGNNWTVVKGVNGTILGNDGIEWTVNKAGIEIQSGDVGGSTASDGKVHAELDTHGGGNTLTTFSTTVNLPSSEVTLTFDYRPRPGSETDSGMRVELGGVSVKIESDALGNISFTSDDGVVAKQMPSSASGWTSITLAFSSLVTGTDVSLVVSGLGAANTLGAYLDNIKMYADQAVLTVDETTLSVDASADLSGFFDGKFGADGPALTDDLTYKLSFNEGSSSFLIDTKTGFTVVLSLVDGAVEGRVGSSIGDLVFRVSVDSETGVVTLDQARAVKHPTSDPNEPVSLNGVVTLTAQIADADGDIATSSIDVGLTFLDDGPLANDDTGSSSASTPATGWLLGNDNVGADTPGKVVSVEGTEPNSEGKIIVKGDYGTLTVTAATGEYSYIQTAKNVADITVTRLGNDSAGYKNTFGYFVKNPDGTPASGTIIWSNIHNVLLNTEYTIEDVNPSNVGWFLIPNGGELNQIDNGQSVTFALIDNEWVAKIGDVVLKSAGGQILFNDNALNLGATAQNWGYLINNELNGELNWEDLLGGGDTDNNDVNLGLSVTLERAGTDSFDYVMSDADGDTSSATLTIDPNIAPYAGWSGGWTDEDTPLDIPASLLLGLAQDADGDDLSLVSVGFRDVDGDGVLDGKGATLVDNGDGTFTFTPAPDFNGYVDLIYTVSDGTNTSTGVYTIDVKPVDDNRPPVADDETVSTVQGVPVTIDALEGDTDPDGDPLTIMNVTDGTHGTAQIVGGQVVYTPVANPGPNGLVDTLEYTISDGKGGTDTGTITVNISDVGPTANLDTVLVGTSTATVNLVLMLDRSGSMSGNRLALMKDAVENLIDSFGSSLVKVMVVPFNADAAAATDGGSVWMSGDIAIDKINALTATGGTDYDDPISEVMSKYGTPPIADKTYVYFLSDGDPNAGGDNTIDATERGVWTTFLSAKGVDAAYAVGIGTGVSTDQLLTVAWAPDGTHSGNVFTVTNENDLSGTLSLISQQVTDDVTTNDVPGLDGFGTPALVSVEFGGTTYTFNQPGNPASYEINLGTGVGKLVIESDGDYTYTPPAGGAYGDSVDINYILQDADGSTSGSTLTIDPNDLPEANNDTGAASVGFMQASGNITASASVVTAPEAWVQDASVLFDNAEDISNVSNNSTGWEGSSGFTLSSSDVDVSHPVGVSFNVERGDWTSGDRWSAFLVKSVPGPNNDEVVASLSGQTGSGTFTLGGITTPGTYYLSFSLSADNDRSPGRPDLAVSQMKYTAWSFTPETTRTINVTAPNMAWVAAVAAVGNVLVNDDLGVQGAEVASVNFSGTDYGAGESIIATYGTLTINANGAFSYTPTAANVPAGTQEVFTYTIEQPDGDFDSATLTIDVAGHAYIATAGNDLLIAPASGGSIDGLGGNDRIVGSDGADTLTGGDGNDYIEGGGGDDVLYGGAGSDYLSGGAGNDTLYGGAGDDILTGGAGSDTFAYTAGDLVGVVNGDIITDFALGAGGDSLDLAALLSGATAGTLDQYLDFTVTNIAGGEATVEINVDPAGTGNHATTLATITVTGVGVGDTSDSIIDTMINHNIDI